CVVRRVIARHDAVGGEDYEAVSDDEFERRRERGEFAVHWRAHGNAYGIPREIDDWLAAGRTVLFNGSRRALPAAQQRYPALAVVNITAEPQVLATRLTGRGRESCEAIAQRLKLAAAELPAHALTVDNGGDIEQGVRHLTAAIRSLTGQI
ncbi:unnamed protein product, partial [Cyprideis torosa]